MSAPDRRGFLAGAASAAAVVALRPELLATVPRLGARVRVGLVGAGRQGRAILAELDKFEDVEVVALCDTDPSRLSSGLRRAPDARGFAAHAELLEAGGCDAVVVATPTHRHREPCTDALAAGKHVYCEAPLASTGEDARATVLAARDAQGVFQTGMQARTNPIYGLARSFYRAGAIGERVGLGAFSRRKTSWRTPASDPERQRELDWRLDPEVSLGLAGELGTHQVDAVHWFTGGYPSAVRGSGAVLAWDDGRELADTVRCELDFRGGLRMGYEATLANSFEGEGELFLGTLGTIRLAGNAGWMFKEADAPTQGWEVYANRERVYKDDGITLIADATKLAAQGELKDGLGLPHPPLYYALEAFLKSCTEGAPVACSAGEGLRAALVGIAMARAVREGVEVAIPADELRVEGR